MPKEFEQVKWDAFLEEDCRKLVRLAVREDLRTEHDWTTVALVPRDARGEAVVVARETGIICGLKVAELLLAEMDTDIVWTSNKLDGDAAQSGEMIANMRGSARDLLTAERLVLNFIGRLSGVATLTNEFMRRVEGTQARLYDTRKTLPCWRLLDKYAVRCGGGTNHRTGLYQSILIKDNHLALGATAAQGRYSPAESLQRVRDFLSNQWPGTERGERMIVEIEVDSLEQLKEVLPEQPDIVLLDNMTPETLRKAVAIRDEQAKGVELEASGGVNLDTVRDIALSGVERISVGALTHSAICFDVGLDWKC